jgi:hypothetical protein
MIGHLPTFSSNIAYGDLREKIAQNRRKKPKMVKSLIKALNASLGGVFLAFIFLH